MNVRLGPSVIQTQVLGAILMREIQTRWGRRNLAFAWVFAEPLIFALPVLAMWHFLRGSYEHGLPLVGFLWSGYLPLLMFRHVTGQCVYIIRSNSALLYHRRITPLDIVVGRCGLEVIGNLAAMAFSFILLYAIGAVDAPADYQLFLAGILYMAWWSFVVGLLIAVLSERSHLVEHIWPPISYMYLPVCGFFYLVEWLPTNVRGLVLTVMPPVHSYEMIRGAMFGNRIQSFYDIGYLTAVLAVLTVYGLVLVRDVRRHLEILE